MEQVTDGVEIVNGQFKKIFTDVKKSKLLKNISKQTNKGIKAIKVENSKRPLWRIVAGFLLCLVVAWKINLYKYAVQLLLFGTVKMVWNVLLGLTVGPFIQGWNNNKKVK
tara:strand:- start:2414 stop:2743 length:330 start_codon:yes stop_codon:yes gene_type:complete